MSESTEIPSGRTIPNSWQRAFPVVLVLVLVTWAAAAGQAPEDIPAGPIVEDPLPADPLPADAVDDALVQSGCLGCSRGRHARGFFAGPSGDVVNEGHCVNCEKGTYLYTPNVFGSGVGHNNGYSGIGLFRPEPLGPGAIFGGMQFLLDYDSDVGGAGGGNAGGGYRWPGRDDRMWGGSFWYDMDDSHFNAFHQLGLSLEALGPRWDGRLNFYVPIGVTALPATTAAGSVVERALAGVDVEAGRRWRNVPLVHDFGAFLGGYHYNNAHRVSGVSARLESFVTPDVGLELKITNDSEFDTNVMVGLTWVFGQSRARRRAATSDLYHRLSRQVVRNPHVVTVVR